MFPIWPSLSGRDEPARRHQAPAGAGKAGLITKTRNAQWRSCKLNGDGLKDAASWMEQYRVYWEESFDRLDAYLKTVTAKKPPGDENV
jgi:hypothetical protein